MSRAARTVGVTRHGAEVVIVRDVSYVGPNGYTLKLRVGSVNVVEVEYVQAYAVEELELALERIGKREREIR